MKKKNLKRVFTRKLVTVAVVAATIMVAVTGCGKKSSNEGGKTARTLQEIKDSKEVVIGVFSDKKPFGYVDENGEYQGYDVYFGNRIAQDLGVTVKYVPVEAASRVEYLRSAKVDIILANFTVNEERSKQVDFALPYMKVALGVVSPDSALITDPEQLNGKTLIVSKGTTAETGQVHVFHIMFELATYLHYEYRNEGIYYQDLFS